MADFVAVIRRTVDGLSENNPEMRGRVYEKARGAVRRQLENMTPRPSDDMINRQLNKLETAIAEVESEYAEALPAIEESEAFEPPEQEPVAAAPAPVAEPEQAAPEAEIEEPQPEAVASVVPAPSAVEAETGEGSVEAAPAVEHEAPEYHPEGAPEADMPAGEQYQEPPAEQELPAEYPAEYEEPETAPAAPQWSAPAEHQVTEDVDARHEPPVEGTEMAETLDEGFHGERAEAEPAPAEPAPETTAPSEWALPEWEDVAPAATPSEPQPVPVAPQDEDVAPAEPERLGMHPVEPEASEPSRAVETEAASAWSFDDSDPFALSTEKKERAVETDISEWSWPVEKAPAATSEEERAGNAWDHIDDLLGFDESGRTQNGAAAPDKGEESGVGARPPAEPVRPTSYRTTPKASRFGLKHMVIGAVIVLLLGGGGYAYWANREAGNAWLSEMIAKIMPAGAEPPAQPADGGEPANQPDEQSATQDGVAPPDAGSTKFTQRLLSDGTERDEGQVGANGTDASQEGKSVAEQTEAGRTQDGESGSQQASSPAAVENGDRAGLPEIAIANGEKMFLYEERLGQSSPTAIPGTVSWSIKEESPGGDAKPEPAIQAQISVPDRGLTALMTIKRNADPSLPASHVIEFVFSLPSTFEGGSIDGVQRVSMKRTEQDRGDPLIAVPAKITDDFHMIALNDFAEAAKVNTELLRSRSWIDIPITYRNGRRALLTLEKGASGIEAFNKTLQAWGALGNTAASGQ